VDIKLYFYLFIIYSFIGWLIEVVGVLIRDKRFVNRGFLIGPYCPIYGFGGICIVFFLTKYMNDPITLFVMAVFICSILEYFTSLIMEKLFKTRWWDYSEKKFNINGRICLETMGLFGVLACFVMYIVNPPLLNLLKSISEPIYSVLFYLIMVIFLIDNILSFKIISNVKLTVKSVTKDSTEEITKYVKETLISKSFLTKRLVKAFPTLRADIKNITASIKKEITNSYNKKNNQ